MYQEWKKSEEYDPKQSPWDKTGKCNYFMKGKEWEREALVTIFDKGEKIVQQNMGIRIKGASTRTNPGKSFNLYNEKHIHTILDNCTFLPTKKPRFFTWSFF